MPHERSLLLNRDYNELVQIQKTVDAEIDSEVKY